MNSTDRVQKWREQNEERYREQNKEHQRRHRERLRHERGRVKRNCAGCGIPFETYDRRQRYCHATCRKQTSYRLMQCIGCGGDFETRDHRQQYCSEKCKNIKKKVDNLI